jgi:hypothetical protein
MKAAQAVLLALPLAGLSQTTVFNDTFSNGSTINAANPVPPTTTSSSYEEIASKSWTPNPPTLSAGDLKWGIVSTSGGGDELQALFTTSPVVLQAPGDYIQLTVTFTATQSILMGDTQWGMGLFNANQVSPWGGGLNNAANNGTSNAMSGGAQDWVGTIAQIAYLGGSMSSDFASRPAQNNANNCDQVTEVNGSTLYGFSNGTTYNSNSKSNVVLTAGSQYAEVLTYTLLASGGLRETAGLYAGSAGGALQTAIAFTNTSPLTTTFDALSMGFRSKVNTNSTVVDLNSVQVVTTAPYSGQSGGCISESVNAARILIGQTNGVVAVTIPSGATDDGPLAVDLVSSVPAAAYPGGAPGGKLTLAFPQNCPYTTTNVPMVAAANGTTLFYLTNATEGACIQAAASSSIVSTVLGVNAPALPLIPPGVFNVTNYGAVGDGVTVNTAAIQNTVNAALSAGGGTVEVPVGTFLSGPFSLGSSLRFQLDAGATLLLLPYQNYPGGTNNPPDFITDSSFHDLELCGPGIINGQGAAWWAVDGGSLDESQRPYEVHLTGGQRVFIHDWNSTNPPMKNLVFDGDDYDVTVQNVTNIASGSSPNTDGLNLQGNRCLVQNSYFSVGDDCIAMGRSSGPGMNILITNITCGTGHGISIGSVTDAGISNVTIVNCTFNGTEYGCRIKADNDRGGLVQDITYANITLTNVDSPILIYSYYNEGKSLNVSPQLAASYAPDAVTSLTPIWRDITFSNITAYSTVESGIIWGRPEMLASNITLDHVTINSPASFHVYNARGVRIVDSKIIPASGSTYQIYTADLTITNDATVTPISSTISGLTSSNSLALEDAPVTISSTNLFGFSPLTLNGSVLFNSGNVTLPAQSVLNYGLGTHSSLLTVGGSLNLNSTINITDGGGFKSGTYTLATYSGNLMGNVALGSVPVGYLCTLQTNIAGLLRLVTSAQPPTINSISMAGGGGTVISGSSGPESDSYYLLGTTNLALPLVDWTALSTNSFDSLGNFSVTNNSQLGPQMFYRLQAR